MTSITIKDIARKFKCSPSTVSRALNDHPNINQDTKDTINEYAQRMGYQKNTISLSLLNKSTKTVGVLVPNINHSHETQMIQGVQSVLNKLGYMVLFCVTNESHELEKEHIKRLLSNRVDAILISISQETANLQNFEHFESINKRQIPFIFIDRDIVENIGSSVVIDDFTGAYLATKHLIDKGYHKIAHLAGPKELLVSKLRLNGYLKCLNDYDIETNQDWIKYVNFEAESAVEPTKELLAGKNRPNAIFGVNDYVCFGAMNLLQSMKIKIPEEIAIIGFDNCPIASHFSPNLSTIDRKSFEIGATAARQILDMLMTGINKNHKNTLSPQLIVRASTSQ
ncbi:MAG: LacI family DNA-binding transcriptional regulator [Arcicella sp.]|nr:LacI family DNA-binding transcriptional regulator [Arcicella sp.]